MRSVHVELSGGLGNQLFQASAAISIAKANGATAHGFFGRHFAKSSHGNSIFDLDWHGQLAHEKLHDVEVVRRALLFRLPQLSRVLDKSSSDYFWIDKHSWDIPELRSYRTFFRGYFQNSEFTIRNEDFVYPTLKSESREYFDATVQAASEMPIGIHVRLGDYLNHSTTHGVLSGDYYASALEAVSADSESKAIWVFSDDETRAMQMLSNAGLKSEMLPASRFGLSDLESLFLLSKCGPLILGNSTFSIWSGMLHGGGAPIIRPNPPFVALEASHTLFPPSFLSVKSSFE